MQQQKIMQQQLERNAMALNSKDAEIQRLKDQKVKCDFSIELIRC